MSTHRQPRGFQGHRSPVLVSPGQSLHSFYPLDPILGCHSLSLLASWPGSDLPAGGVPSSPASHCPPAVFRVLCFRFLYSGLLYFKSLEVTSSESRLLSTQGRSILTEYHFPSGALQAVLSHFVFAISRLKNLALPKRGKDCTFSRAPHGAWYLGPSTEAGGVNDDDHTCQLWRTTVSSVVMSSCLFLGLGAGLQTVAASGLLNSPSWLGTGPTLL